MAATRPPISREDPMTHPSKRALLAAACASLAFAAPAFARDHGAGSIKITDAWCPPTPPGAPTAAGYLTIANTGRAPDRLLGGSTPVAAQVQLHSMTTTGGVMRMRPIVGGLAIAPGAATSIQAGGETHLMLIGLKRPLVAGDHVAITLDFARAGRVPTDFVVRPPSGTHP
ncbi:MAG TPA: copper chaperone PCu(A)C, partial [Caulobacteraceae bacterium]